MNSRFIYFDLGNVLVTFDHRIAAHHLAESANCSQERVFGTVFASDLQQRYETGLVSDEEYANEINQILDSQLSTEQVLEAISDIFQPNWPILNILERLQSSGVPMGILSNTCDAHWQWLMRQEWPMLQDWFQHRILSYQVGCMKPDSGIYEACERSCGLSGTQIFFTDDRSENVAAAADRGWATHHFRDAAQLWQSIDQWLNNQWLNA